jgi:aspartyl protease family protein
LFLFNSALEQGYSKRDTADPFVPKNFTRKVNSSSSTRDVAAKSIPVPLIKEGRVYSLKAKLSGLGVSFILDTGAGETSISSDVERKLLAICILKSSSYLNNGYYRLADGSIVECKRVMLPKVTIGNKTVYNVIAAISPNRNAPNLLGQSFLSKIRNWSIDNAKSTLNLQ